jgi:hypothetical protein
MCVVIPACLVSGSWLETSHLQDGTPRTLLFKLQQEKEDYLQQDIRVKRFSCGMCFGTSGLKKDHEAKYTINPVKTSAYTKGVSNTELAEKD